MMLLSKKEYNKRINNALRKERERIWEREETNRKFEYAHTRITNLENRVLALEKAKK